MAIPKKEKPVESAWKRYIFREGGWKRLIKVGLGVGVFVVLGIKGLDTYKKMKVRKLYSDGEMLVQAGQKGSEMEMYFNDNRKKEEFLKPIIDTNEKVPFGRSNLK